VDMVCPQGRFALPPWTDDHPQRLQLQQRLTPDHLARRIDQAVARLDRTAWRRGFGRTGSPPYRSDLLPRAVLYEVQRGQHSPADWHRDAREAEPVRWLLRGCQPSRSAWYAFRDRLAPVLDDFNRQVLAQAVSAGHTPATRAALDGTLVAANAARHRLANADKVRQRAAALDQAASADGADGAPRPAWMAATAAGRQRPQQALLRAQQRLAQLQRHNDQQRAGKRRPAEQVVVSVSDPEAAVGRDKEGVYRPLYNIQVADDLDAPFVLGHQVFAQPNDAGTHLPKKAFRWLAEEQVYVCPAGQRLAYERSSRPQRSGTERLALQPYRCPPVHCQGCPLQRRCTPRPDKGRTISRSEHEGLTEALRQRMATASAKALYRRRGQSVELVNADWKAHRRLRRFSARGLRRVRCQVGLVVLAHNLITLLDQESKAEAQEVETISTSDVTPTESTA
jgi:hypothetical protein